MSSKLLKRVFPAEQSRAYLTYAGLGLALLYSFYNIGFFDAGRLLRGASNLGTFVTELFPPNWAVTGVVLVAVGETVQMAFVGTVLGFALAVPLAVLGARNLVHLPVAAAARLLLAVVRTVPALLWAVILVITVGFGPLAGALGLALYSLGYLGKLYYEAFEGVDPDVFEAVKSTGCSRTQLIRYAVLPESANVVLSQLLFMFEYNVRSSAILGFVGAGGVGFLMLGYLQRFEYSRLMTVLIITLLVVLAIDFLSSRLRNRFLLTRAT